MKNKDIVVKLSNAELRKITEGLTIAVEDRDTVRVMIQEDGLKFKRNNGVWTPPLGQVENR